MRIRDDFFATASKTDTPGHILIALGLATICAWVLWPALPVVTAMALISWGATIVTTNRFHRSPGLAPIVFAHLTIYGGLYAIFVGAAIHATVTRSEPRLNAPTICDVLLSILVMLAAFRVAVRAILGFSSSDA